MAKFSEVLTIVNGRNRSKWCVTMENIPYMEAAVLWDMQMIISVKQKL